MSPAHGSAHCSACEVRALLLKQLSTENSELWKENRKLRAEYEELSTLYDKVFEIAEYFEKRCAELKRNAG